MVSFLSAHVRAKDATCYPMEGAVISLTLRTTVGSRGQFRKDARAHCGPRRLPRAGSRHFSSFLGKERVGLRKETACFSALCDRVLHTGCSSSACPPWGRRAAPRRPALHTGATGLLGGGIRRFPPAPSSISHDPLPLISVSYLLLHSSKQFEGKMKYRTEKRQKNLNKTKQNWLHLKCPQGLRIRMKTQEAGRRETEDTRPPAATGLALSLTHFPNPGSCRERRDLGRPNSN